MAPADPRLITYLTATAEAAANAALVTLLEMATPIMRNALSAKTQETISPEFEDLLSSAREQLIRRLVAQRNGQDEKPIADFHAYAARVAYQIWAERLRSDHPQRSALLNRIRYLLEKRGKDFGLGSWQNASGTKYCGPLAFAGQSSAEHSSPRLHKLLAAPSAISAQVFGRASWEKGEMLSLLRALLEWIDGPIALRDLVSVAAELLQLVDQPVQRLDDQAHSLRASQPGPREEAAWKEYLQWLWAQLSEIPPRQAAAFLLGSSVLREFELHGLASVRLLAPILEMEPEQLAQCWPLLPMDDLRTAALLDCSRQQIINLRRVARDRLGQSWLAYQEAANRSGNKDSVSPS